MPPPVATCTEMATTVAHLTLMLRQRTDYAFNRRERKRIQEYIGRLTKLAGLQS